jgi:hypothetical protein
MGGQVRTLTKHGVNEKLTALVEGEIRDWSKESKKERTCVVAGSFAKGQKGLSN